MKKYLQPNVNTMTLNAEYLLVRNSGANFGDGEIHKPEEGPNEGEADAKQHIFDAWEDE